MLIKDAKKITESLTRTSQKCLESLTVFQHGSVRQGGNYLRLRVHHVLVVMLKEIIIQGIQKLKRFNIKDLKQSIIHYGLKQWQNKLMKIILGGMTQEIYKVLNTWEKYLQVCRLTPNTKHWLPTQERQYILAVDPQEIPDNLIIRLSGSKINGSVPKAWEYTSTVVTDNNPSCKAYLTDKNKKVHTTNEFDNYTKEQKKELDFGHCGDCRMCWNKEIKNVSYGKH